MTASGEAPRPEWVEVDERRSFSIAEQIEDMKRLAREEAESRAEVERFVDSSRERERRLLKAIAALEGVPLGAGGKPKAAPKVAAKAPAVQLVSPAVADEILVVVRELLAGREDQTFSRPELAKLMPRSGETIRRGLELLREQERVRLAGKRGTGRTAKNLYALMPDVD